MSSGIRPIKAGTVGESANHLKQREFRVKPRRATYSIWAAPACARKCAAVPRPPEPLACAKASGRAGPDGDPCEWPEAISSSLCIPAQPRFSSLKKSLPLSSMTMNAGKSSTSMRQMASIPSSGYSTVSTFLMQSCASRAAGPPIEPR